MNVSYHFHFNDNSRELRAIKKGIKKIMSTLEEMEVILGEINESTDEIAADLDDLIATVTGGLTGDEAAKVVTGLRDVQERLRGTASEWPVMEPEPEPEFLEEGFASRG